jgi:hypothetical protein
MLKVFARRPFRTEVSRIALVPHLRLAEYLKSERSVLHNVGEEKPPSPTSIKKDMSPLDIPGLDGPGWQWRFFDTSIAVALAARGWATPI